MEIYLVRHTKVAVPPGIVYGHTDVSLSDSFEEEAAVVRKKVEGICCDAVWSSPLSRCVRLANYCGFRNIQTDDRLKELNFGEWEMKSWDEISQDARSERWFEDWIHVCTPGGESFQGQYDRVSNFLDEICSLQKSRVLVFAHGGVLTCANVYFGKYPLEEAFKHIPAHGEVLVAEV